MGLVGQGKKPKSFYMDAQKRSTYLRQKPNQQKDLFASAVLQYKLRSDFDRA
jgi:hypothetical protein